MAQILQLAAVNQTVEWGGLGEETARRKRKRVGMGTGARTRRVRWRGIERSVAALFKKTAYILAVQ